jgi:hypothetical protein
MLTDEQKRAILGAAPWVDDVEAWLEVSNAEEIADDIGRYALAVAERALAAERERGAKLRSVAAQVLADMEAQGLLLEWQTTLFEALEPNVGAKRAAKWDHIDGALAVIELARAGRWVWMENPQCKYIELRIDMRDGGCIIKDREGKRIDPATLAKQLTQEQYEPWPKDRMPLGEWQLETVKAVDA